MRNPERMQYVYTLSLFSETIREEETDHYVRDTAGYTLSKH